MLPTGPDCAWLKLVYRNDGESAFAIESLSYSLDDNPVFTAVDVNRKLGAMKELVVYDGGISPGEHRVSVRLVYRAHGWGVFSCLNGYEVTVNKVLMFEAEAGKKTQVETSGLSAAPLPPTFEDPPEFRFRLSSEPKSCRSRVYLLPAEVPVANAASSGTG